MPTDTATSSRIADVDQVPTNLWVEAVDVALCAGPALPASCSSPRVLPAEFLIHAVGVVVGEIADQLMPTWLESDRCPADGMRGDPVACPTCTRCGRFTEASGFVHFAV
jgi:hypothetical protein